MRRIPQRLATGLLLVLYGGISLLGYGLHDLVPEDAHHHHEVSVEHDVAGPPAFTAAADDDHECDICQFLDQARSVPPEIQTAVVWQHLVAALEIAAPRFTSQTAELSHAPRGPPVLFG